MKKEIRDELTYAWNKVAIFHEIFLLSVPKFDAGTSREEIIARLIRFDIMDAVKILERFPCRKSY